MLTAFCILCDHGSKIEIYKKEKHTASCFLFLNLNVRSKGRILRGLNYLLKNKWYKKRRIKGKDSKYYCAMYKLMLKGGPRFAVSEINFKESFTIKSW